MDSLLTLEAARRAAYHDSYLASVVAVDDPESLGRVQVVLLNFDGIEGQDAPIWARVAVPFASDNCGAYLLPNVDDEVLVSFVNGDSRAPVVVGAMWNGRAAPPETLGGSGDRVDRWSLVGTRGTRIAIVEESPGSATISLTTPGQVSCTMTETAGGSVEIQAGGSTVTIDVSGVKVETAAKVEVQASTVQVSAGMVTVDAGMSRFSGVVQCDTLISNSVVSAAYTPGAGNVW